MADRKTLTEYVNKSNLPKQTKLWLNNKFQHVWKTDRQVPEYLFKLRNIIQEKPKIRNKRDFRAYQPKEVYVELKIYKELGGDARRNVYAFTHAFPDGHWVEEQGDSSTLTIPLQSIPSTQTLGTTTKRTLQTSCMMILPLIQGVGLTCASAEMVH
jgi:hypothetical protein